MQYAKCKMQTRQDVGRRSRLVRELLQFREQFERPSWRGVVDVDGFEPFDDLALLRRRRLWCREQTELPRARVAAVARERGTTAARQFVALEAAEDLLRARDDGTRQTCQPCDLNPVAAIRSPADDLAQKDDVVFPLTRRDV